MRTRSDGDNSPRPEEWPDTPFPLGSSLLLVGRRGSESHGTYVPPDDPNSVDDRDLMGVCVPPAPWTLGMRRWEGAESIKGVWDVVLYDFRKFVSLLCKQNPNVIGMLWLEDEDYILRSEDADLLIQHRDLFRARELAYDAFCGYAYSQLKKLTSGVCAGYMGAKRKALVERFGYDCKNANHLVRLLHTGEEFLRTGRLQVRRTWDREMLIEIKRGGWELARVQQHADDYFAKLKTARDRSPLPEAIDMDAVNELVVGIMRGRID